VNNAEKVLWDLIVELTGRKVIPMDLGQELTGRLEESEEGQ